MNRALLILVFIASVSYPVLAEDGYELWLRYRLVSNESLRAEYQASLAEIVLPGQSPTVDAIRLELERGLRALLGTDVPTSQIVRRDGSLLVGKPADLPLIEGLGLNDELSSAGDEGFVIRTAQIDGLRAIVITGNSDVGLLYGAFRLLRMLQTHQSLESLPIVERPRIRLRVLNHWDNLDRTVERGYAGFSLWDWHKLPDYLDPRYTDYARANASIGINGAVLTNVNANATSLTAPYLEKAAALAGVFRTYGIRVYLTARFSAPIEIGGLATADPLDPAVRDWWRKKADEIYRHIPDFGGFLVKADSEGQPGPHRYNRTHAEGANMLADALAAHGGAVMWRAFVYSNEQPVDRAMQAYNEFVPLDGQFRPNVLIQVKNGPIDFQPREPFHPLFGAMPETPLMTEFQITQEYLGFATHLVYLGTMWKEVLESETFALGEGSPVASIVDGTLDGHATSGMAGVSNIGTDRNWCGSAFACANWYAFGRLAWDPSSTPEEIADEWIRSTFTNDSAFVEPVSTMMMGTHEAAVNYMTPLGLHHLMARGHHYGPGPWVSGGPRADWTSVYYHRADSAGIGFDRSPSGSDAAGQYHPPLSEIYGDPKRVPEELLLWFHHVSWDHPTRSGRTLWEELVYRYHSGVEYVRSMQETWRGLMGMIDAERFEQVRAFLAIQEAEARWWRDSSILYFQTFSGMPVPEGYEPPAHDLEYYMSISHPYAPGI